MMLRTPGLGRGQLAYSYDQNKRVTQESNPLLASEALTYGYDAGTG